jgi:flagellar biosynthetic protein FlhB
MAERGAASRTEEPTPRRLAEARRQGQVAISPELTGAVAFAGVVVVVTAAGAAACGQLVAYLRGGLTLAVRAGDPSVALGAAARQAIALLALPLGVAWVLTLAGGLVQTGALVAPRAVRFDARRALPSARRLVEAGTLATVAKGAAGVLVLLGVAWVTLAPLLRPMAGLAGGSPGGVLVAVGALGRRVAWPMALALVGLGGVDLLWRRARHHRSLRMSRAEVDRERKQHEGDPHRKVERRRLHREVVEAGSTALGAADFLVTGARVAFALAYRGGPAAPVVVARGERLLAARLTDEARLRRMPIFPDPALAEALAAVRDGEEIPSALHEPVARIVKVILERGARSS